MSLKKEALDSLYKMIDSFSLYVENDSITDSSDHKRISTIKKIIWKSYEDIINTDLLKDEELLSYKKLFEDERALTDRAVKLLETLKILGVNNKKEAEDSSIPITFNSNKETLH